MEMLASGFSTPIPMVTSPGHLAADVYPTTVEKLLRGLLQAAQARTDNVGGVEGGRRLRGLLHKSEEDKGSSGPSPASISYFVKGRETKRSSAVVIQSGFTREKARNYHDG